MRDALDMGIVSIKASDEEKGSEKETAAFGKTPPFYRFIRKPRYLERADTISSTT